jgi:hypothetical protein
LARPHGDIDASKGKDKLSDEEMNKLFAVKK